MSTLLTPIITQLELDRDRFKILINGDVNATVVLEGRTEKSIAGQVKDRIDSQTLTLQQAIDAAESARDLAILNANQSGSFSSDATDAKLAAEAAKIAAESARDLAILNKDATADILSDVQDALVDAEAARDEAQGFRNETEGFKNDSQLYRNEAVAASGTATNAADEATAAALVATNAASVLGGAIVVRLGGNPTASFPGTGVYVDPVDPIVFVGSTPVPFNTGAVEFVNRSFQFEEYNTVTEAWEASVGIGYTGTDLSFVLPAESLDPLKEYRWRIVDRYRMKDKNPSSIIETQSETWTPIYFDGTAPSRVPVGVIDKPVVTMPTAIDTGLTPVINSTPYTTDGSALHFQTVWAIFDNGIPVYVVNTQEPSELESFTVPEGILVPGKQYHASCRYISDSGTRLQSEWATPVPFVTKREYKFLEAVQESIVDSVTMDYRNGAMFTVDGTTNPVLTLVDPQAEFTATVKVFVDGTGTVTWPVGVVWNGGSAPTVGATFTLVSFTWVGTQWIGSLVASN